MTADKVDAMQHRMLPPAAIIVDGSPFVHSYGPPPAGLETSIAEIGVLNAPLVVRRDSRSWWCVAGSRRIRAVRNLGIETVPVRLFPDGTDPTILFRAAIDDNRWPRTLNPVECARLCRQLEETAGLSGDEIRRDYLPRMGLHPSPVLHQRLKLIPDLAPAVQDLLATGWFPLKNIPPIHRFDTEDQERLAEVMDHFRLGTNRQQQLLELCRDLSQRDRRPLREWLTEAGAYPLPAAEEENLPLRTERMLGHLHTCLHPALAAREAVFRTVQNSLAGAGDVRLGAWPFFEKAEYRLEVTFRHTEELRQILERLLESERQAAIEKLFPAKP